MEKEEEEEEEEEDQRLHSDVCIFFQLLSIEILVNF